MHSIYGMLYKYCRHFTTSVHTIRLHTLRPSVACRLDCEFSSVYVWCSVDTNANTETGVHCFRMHELNMSNIMPSNMYEILGVPPGPARSGPTFRSLRKPNDFWSVWLFDCRTQNAAARSHTNERTSENCQVSASVRLTRPHAMHYKLIIIYTEKLQRWRES